MAVHLDTGVPNDSGDLKFVVREQGTTTMLELDGEWDLVSVPTARQAISRVLDRDNESLVLDLSRLKFIDSSGLHATVELSERATAQNKQLVIIRGPRGVQRAFEITGLAATLPLIDKTASPVSPGARRHPLPSAHPGAAGRRTATVTTSADPRVSPPTPSHQTADTAVAPALPADHRPRPSRGRRPLRVAGARGEGLTSWTARAPDVALLLDLDPDLGCGIERHDWESARQATRANLAQVNPGEWTLPTHAADPGHIIGLIVADGMISRETALSDHVVFELLTPGDVLVLPGSAPDLVVGGAVGLTALSRARLIVLGRPFIHATVRWPVLLANLHHRLEAQRRRLAVQALAAHLPRAEDRVLLTLWLLATRCGRVTPDGIALPLFLSHEVLGRLAAARRPTISLALRELETADLVRRRSRGHLTLTPNARRRVHQLTAGSNGVPPIGPGLTPQNGRRRRRSSVAQTPAVPAD